jgi:hypothetical protein
MGLIYLPCVCVSLCLLILAPTPVSGQVNYPTELYGCVECHSICWPEPGGGCFNIELCLDLEPGGYNICWELAGYCLLYSFCGSGYEEPIDVEVESAGVPKLPSTTLRKAEPGETKAGNQPLGPTDQAKDSDS